MIKLLYATGILILFNLKSFSQTEKVYVSLDKYTCRAGDTVWIKAWVLNATRLSSLSTNLYVQVYSEQGVLLSQDLFPVFHGLSIGQLIIKDSIPTNNYYLVAFTKEQLNYDTSNLFSVPILVYNKEKPGSIYHKQKIPACKGCTSGMIAGITWATNIYNGQLYSMLHVDSGERKLLLVAPQAGSSNVIAAIDLNKQSSQKYSIFPVDTTKTEQTLLLYEDSVLIGRQFIRLKNAPETVAVTTDTLDNSPEGYNSWEIKLPDSTLYYTAISVEDADRSIAAPLSVEELRNSYTEDLGRPVKLIDTSFITFTGNATRESGKRIKDELSHELIIAGLRDTTCLFTRLVETDSRGNFAIDSLFFFDHIDLRFQINKHDDSRTKDIKLNITRYIPPVIDSSLFTSNWEDDKQRIGDADTAYTKVELATYELFKAKMLRAVVVKGWKNSRRELDHQYTTGAFSEPAIYSFDVRTEKNFNDLGSYLRTNFSRFQGGFGPSDTPRDVMQHPILYFVDEENYTWDQLSAFDCSRMAYIKCFENDLLGDDDFIRFKNGIPRGSALSSVKGVKDIKIPTDRSPLIIAIYTRKGKDFRTMRGGLNKISVKGFSPILNFNPDRATVYWDPTAFANRMRIRFTNKDPVIKFRLRVEGVSNDGHVVHYEAVIR